eukprot:scaffold2238_cov145-Skeletonema_menzelii.AAC.4
MFSLRRKPIDNQHYGEWCPEGFDRRNRVQRYSGSDMEDHFGWVFDKINGAVEASLGRPLELVITEHTPSSCRSIVNVFEQRDLCSCQQQQQQCQCYVAQLTLVHNAIYSLEKPVRRDLECWDLSEPATSILMEQNSVVIKTGESLWEWRGRISDVKDSNSCDEANSSVKTWKKGQKNWPHPPCGALLFHFEEYFRQNQLFRRRWKVDKEVRDGYHTRVSESSNVTSYHYYFLSLSSVLGEMIHNLSYYVIFLFLALWDGSVFHD